MPVSSLFEPELILNYIFLDLLCDGVQFLGLFDQHLHFLLPLQNFLDVLVHHALQVLQLLDQLVLLVLILVAVEEGLDREYDTNCCL